MKPRFFLYAMLIAALGLLAFETYAFAAGGRVDITPRRVILNARDRAGEFTLLNLGQETSTIRVSIINYRQDERGVYETLEAPLNAAFDPQEVLRLSPRQFTLPPGGRQKVRFSLRKPADLPAGEYRFHLLATRMAEFGPAKQLDAGEKAVGLVPNIGAAIPIIVRHGDTSVSVTLSDLRYTPSNASQKPELALTINRSGNASAIGKIQVLWIPDSGQGVEIGLSSNLNVFPENDRRLVTVPLKSAPSGSGQFQVIYLNEETKTPYADATLRK